MQVQSRPPSGWPALVLNADFRPLSYYPLSIWPWEEVVKAVYQDRVSFRPTTRWSAVPRWKWSCPASSR
ncbi:MAG: HNH endonuclease [bacterium]|nr:MAG: HNH endonuclease [bacterium]